MRMTPLPLAKFSFQLILVICAVFNVLFPVLRRKYPERKGVCVCEVVVHVAKCVCVLHGDAPLLSVNQQVLQLCVRIYCSLISMADLSFQS